MKTLEECIATHGKVFGPIAFNEQIADFDNLFQSSDEEDNWQDDESIFMPNLGSK